MSTAGGGFEEHVHHYQETKAEICQDETDR